MPKPADDGMVRFSLRSNISSGALYLRTACQDPWVSPEGLHQRLVIVRFVEQHLRMTLRPTRPIWGDIRRIKVVVSVKEYRGGQEGLLESLHESRIIESRATKAVRKETGVAYSSPTW